jgi:hypothetical protein
MALTVINKILQNLITACILSLVLLCAGLVIWYFKKDSGTSLQDILFYVGAVPLVLFTLGQLGNFIGKGEPSYQLSRSVSNQSANTRALKDERDIKSQIKSGINWIMAGLLVWLFGYFV